MMTEIRGSGVRSKTAARLSRSAISASSRASSITGANPTNVARAYASVCITAGTANASKYDRYTAPRSASATSLGIAGRLTTCRTNGSTTLIDPPAPNASSAREKNGSRGRRRPCSTEARNSADTRTRTANSACVHPRRARPCFNNPPRIANAWFVSSSNSDTIATPGPTPRARRVAPGLRAVARVELTPDAFPPAHRVVAPAIRQGADQDQTTPVFLFRPRVPRSGSGMALLLDRDAHPAVGRTGGRHPDDAGPRMLNGVGHQLGHAQDRRLGQVPQPPGG